jgi:O-succinylbenzoate synthase
MYSFEFQPYQRRFQTPLVTKHGIWEIRTGIILQLVAESGKIGWGEIAPLPWFGSETLAQALDFCRQLPHQITTETILAIPAILPACQFGFESAWEELISPQPEPILASSALLPAGKAALERLPELLNYGTFKWKIGVAPLNEELEIFHQLVTALPAGSQLRLDANGGLELEAAKIWLGECDNLNSKVVEFLEQPLAVNQLAAMQELANNYATPIALDESVTGLPQLQDCYQRGWRGVFVIKAAIAGSPSRLRQFLKTYRIDAVFSSVLETAIGRKAALKLAAELNHPHRAVGFGVEHWFAED